MMGSHHIPDARTGTQGGGRLQKLTLTLSKNKSKGRKFNEGQVQHQFYVIWSKLLIENVRYSTMIDMN